MAGSRYHKLISSAPPLTGASGRRPDDDLASRDPAALSAMADDTLKQFAPENLNGRLVETSPGVTVKALNDHEPDSDVTQKTLFQIDLESMAKPIPSAAASINQKPVPIPKSPLLYKP